MAAPAGGPVPGGVGDKQLLDVQESHAFEATADESRCVSLFTEALDVAQVHQAVVGEPRMEHDLHQSGQTDTVDSRDAGDRLRVQHAVPHDPQAAGIALGDEHVAVR